ncbi:hypothetical protein F4561_006600 [Lipingzhangella halophila]|uniref:Uncharacterized protein n=1 Tax=Lipingzhangella halophila TaxID=1783352 RepID=A0A7W7RPE7_9ACTN|nr:hypothetical protein [Lipingzhangella halophila]MBB4935691.1 hypothetical protein [Lipingzhangella halophila]
MSQHTGPDYPDLSLSAPDVYIALVAILDVRDPEILRQRAAHVRGVLRFLTEFPRVTDATMRALWRAADYYPDTTAEEVSA